MGLLAVDVSRFGVVMSADSQPVEISDGETRVLANPGAHLRRRPIITRAAGGFVGFTGFVGTEMIGSLTTTAWLTRFGDKHRDVGLAEYASALGEALTEEWRKLALSSVLEILVSGVEDGGVQFWFIRNSDGLHEDDWTHHAPRAEFHVVDDLDRNYIPRDLLPGQTKEDVLASRTYSFRQGALLPAAPVFDAFGAILQTISAQSVEGFEPIGSLDDLAYFARQRMEFLKRLYSQKHGIYKGSLAPVGGKVHVLGVTREGEVREYNKIRGQVKTLHPAAG